MIFEAFQGAIARNADAILMMAIGLFALSGGTAFIIAASMIFGKRRGHQPSSSGDHPEPPRSGSGVTPPSNGLRGFPSRTRDDQDHLPRIARLRAELEDLVYAATGGNAFENVSTMRWVANRLEESQITGLQPEVHAIRVRAHFLEDALQNARDTLEATKPPPSSDD